MIGLGLKGRNHHSQLLRAAGVRSIGIDIDERMVRLAETMGCDLALSRRLEQLEDIVSNFAGGHGTDAVIITAGTDSTDPVDLAAHFAGRRAEWCLSGGPRPVQTSKLFQERTGTPRNPAPYGPGRFDPEYEEQDWITLCLGTLDRGNRNMMAFVELPFKTHRPGILTTHPSISTKRKRLPTDSRPRRTLLSGFSCDTIRAVR